jgi:hypothetical protein
MRTANQNFNVDTKRDLGDLDLSTLSTESGSGLWQAAEIQGERQLLVALLEDAIRSYQKNIFSSRRRGQRLFREVNDWFMEPAHPDVPLPFEYVCDALQIDADFVRNTLGRWQEQAMNARQAA